ncbi:MAG TPA: hypothetical protein VMW19_03815 [Myxococcota bacterium]|nr:hypothetical protein [Myxococcota bacterium]
MTRGLRARAGALAALALARAALADGAPPLVDPAAKRPVGASASEYWDLVASFEGGVCVTARFTIFDEGAGRHSAAAFGHFLRSDAPPVAFQNGRRDGRWRLSPDGRRIEIGSSLLALSDTARHFEVDNDKRGVKVFLDWSTDASAQSVPASALPDSYAVDLLQLASPVRASIQVGGMASPLRLSGTLSLTHTSMSVAEDERVLRRTDVASIDPDSGAYLLDLLDPAGKRFSWIFVRAEGASALTRSGLDPRFESGGEKSGYPIASGLVIDRGEVQGRIAVKPPRLEVDPLATLPAPLRMLYSLRRRPHRSWAESSYELSWVPGPEHPAVRVAGDAIATFSFLDALPPDEIRP